MLKFKKKILPKFRTKNLEAPIREEIYSCERLEQYARFLASELSVSMKKKKGSSLLPRVIENEQYLKSAYKKLTDYAEEGVTLSPASEWIIDNFHIIQDQIREIKEDLPESYYRELPKVTKGELKGYPRVYAMALTLVAHLDSHINISVVKKFVSAYQETSPLLIGEIWALPIAIRIALIENLRRLAYQEVICQERKQEIDKLADNFLKDNEEAEEEIEKLYKKLSKLLGRSHVCDCSTISQLSQRLHARNPEILPAYEYLDKYLAKKGLKIEEVVRIEHQLQTSSQASVSNIITSLRLLSNTDWHEFFEHLSLVDKILNQDPSEAYQKMLFSSRDQYRHAIERIHKKTDHGEIEIAKKAIHMARKAKEEGNQDHRTHHVGYYLIRKGVRKLEKIINYKPTMKEYLKRTILDNPTTFYLVFLSSFIIILLLPLFLYASSINNQILWPILICIVALIPASDSALNIFNLFITNFVGPYILPKIDIKNRIPDHAKTFVIVPTIIGQKNEIEKLITDLEIRFLANQDDNLFFALLSDFTDSDNEYVDTDDEIMDYLRFSINNLNEKYKQTQDIFYVFHRKRIWNQKDKVWMGHERKRGKIHEFNKFLRGEKNLSFNMAPEYSSFFSEIKYVITLDSDTKLPRDAAKKLIGTILHPLNRPQFDEESKTIKKGYSILQPRISITPESSGKSLFAKIYSGHTGIDPYTTAVSDTYQDLFGEGIYTGKGLYVVDCFEASLKNRVPENSILSHDLFEGVFARTALVSDIEFLDDYPSHYDSFSKRHHRWIRGDWQIFKWIFSRIPDSRKQLVETPLSLISRWKIFDNLRRSLVAPMTLIWLILSWSIFPGNSLLWTLVIITMMALPLYVQTTSQLFKYSRQLSFKEHLEGIVQDLKMSLSQLAITILTLPYQSYLNVDAILRTLYRTFISKKDLLEWTTAAQVESGLDKGPRFVIRMFKYSFLFCIVATILTSFYKPYALFTSSFFIGAWIFSPYILNKLSRTIEAEAFTISEEDKRVFHSIACRTWNFFECFVSEESNWLPPDNFQQSPEDLVAHRTSPTNMGLYLLSCCSAYNFGYIGPNELSIRLEQTLSTMQRLPRLHGHFYNWYETDTLNTLHPEYISTVDSGNLAGHLLAVKQTCLELLQKEKRVLKYSNWKLAINDILIVAMEECSKLNRTLTSLSSSDDKNLESLIQETSNILNNKNDTIDEQDEFNRIKEKSIRIKQAIEGLTREHGESHFVLMKTWILKLQNKLDKIQHEINILKDDKNHKDLKRKINRISSLCHQMSHEMDFSFLYDKKRKLFTIGHNINEGKNDDSFYDLLASEARLTSFISIAKGDVPEEHWFHLGRQITTLFNHRSLISWSASMFEYLMPLLVMKDYSGTLLHETHHAVIKQQIAYGDKKKLPWGISESAYNARDLNMNYQYGPFGVPGMGFKRGLSQDYVVSPYSTVLATLVSPNKSITNLKKLIKNKFLTNFGFYEAIDYTKERIPPKQDYAVIRSFMAHHQGMSLVALDNLLHHNIVRDMFHKDPIVKSTELLLQERIPKRISILHPRPEEVDHKKMSGNEVLTSIEYIKNVKPEIPQLRVLSNGNYTVMVTSSGSGFSKSYDESIFRWESDPTLENGGQYFFISENEEDSLSSITFSPLHKNQKNYRATFSTHKAEFWFEKKNLTAHTEVIVSAEDNVELRRLTITNRSGKEQVFELTSYTEPVLSTLDADIAHPAFNKLFLKTEYINERSALIARRKKSDSDEEIYGIQQVIFDNKKCTDLQYETNRLKFLGRRNSWAQSQGLKYGHRLSGSLGSVLDPIFSFKIKIKLMPYETTKLLFVGGEARSRNEALRLLDQYHDINIFEREDKMSWTQSQVQLRHLNLEQDEANTFQKLATPIIFSCPKLRPPTNIIKENKKDQSALWSYGISGDLPIILVTIKNKHNIKFIQDILQLHEYLRDKRVQFDLVLLCDETSSYRMAIHEELLQQIRMTRGQALLNKRGGIFLLRKDIVPVEDVILLKAVSRVFFNAHEGQLSKQVDRLLRVRPYSIKERIKNESPKNWVEKPLIKPNLEFFNGYGGFKDDGREYQIYLEKNKNTPAPWINVIANSKGFGFTISESGSSYTWSLNSRENRITPWSNDSIIDPSGEILYLRDNDSNQYWSPTPGPKSSGSPYLVRHGQGYTIFEHHCLGIKQTTTMYVSMDDEIKFIRVKLKNESGVKRHISAYLYLQWVLGFHREKTGHFVTTEKNGNFFLAQNPFLLDFSNRVTFVSTNREVSSFTCDRASFLGRLRSYNSPLGLEINNLDGKIGAGFDPCLALKLDIELESDKEEECIFILGQVNSSQFDRKSLSQYVERKRADEVLEGVKKFWDETLNTIQVKTSHRELDLLVNRWLLYQTLSSRIWARTAFYQSGGAYGFRDQLQDVTSLIHTRPDLARNHILTAAAHQFPEGDVLHWWHPPTDKGVRTRFSDDLLWLPFVVDYYIKVTGDESIFEEQVPFIEGPLLSEGQDDLYIQTNTSKKKYSIYEHCVRTIDYSLNVGEHGLPYIGSGDWNDGMNMVGNKGKGESIWMAWFLGSNLDHFIKICESRGDFKRSILYKEKLNLLKKSVESTGWDGAWYRRAYFDDGSPLGSKDNDECRIDSIAQSWSVLSGLGNKDHRELALNSAKKYLINKKDNIVHLFTPPFEKIEHNPGYIKNYPIGVRENGGQYTHAAIWLAMSFAQNGDGNVAFEIMNHINPINHSKNEKNASIYMIEPYVITADIYSHPQHVGRGGWSWYTGSSSWFYRAYIESILGIHKQNKNLRLNPSLPDGINEYQFIYKYKNSTYEVTVYKNQERTLIIDGRKSDIKEEVIFPLVDDNSTHKIEINI